MKIGLEDFCEDIVGKAMRGTATSDDALAAASGVSIASIQALRRGDGDETTARQVAGTLGLDPDKLVDSFNAAWEPEERLVPNLFMTNTPYHDMFVNAYVVSDSASQKAAMFDTGADAGALLEYLAKEDLQLTHVFITHTHKDHIMDLPKVRRAYPDVQVHTGEREPLEGASPVKAGDAFQLGSLEVTARLTWGHAQGGITYVIDGLAAPLAVVGDAIFAGSMGGGMVSYEDALRTNREEILTLPDETILCPGHGPLTTVGEEKAHNPFF